MKLETVLYILPFSFLSDQQQVFENWASGTEKGREELTGPKEMMIHELPNKECKIIV